MNEVPVGDQPLRHILLPCDDTDATDGIVQWFINTMHKKGDLVHVMHVVPVHMEQMAAGIGPFEYYPLAIEPNPEEDRANMEAARKFLQTRVMDRLAAAAVPFKVGLVHFLTDKSSVGEAICARADYLSADAVIIAKHQQSDLSRILMGSVTDYCLKHCKRPLVILNFP